MQNSTPNQSTEQEKAAAQVDVWLDNFTGAPNVLYDKFLPVVSAAAWKIISFVCRKTYGWEDQHGKRKTWDALSLSAIVAGTGLSDSCAWETMHELVESGLMLRGRETRHGFMYSLNRKCDVESAISVLKPKPRKVYQFKDPERRAKSGKKQTDPPIKLDSQTPIKLDSEADSPSNLVGEDPPIKLDSTIQLSWNTKETIKRNYQKRDCAQGALLPPSDETPKPAEPKDPREAGLFAAIRKTWPAGAVCDIDNRDAKAIRDYLNRKPAFPGPELEMCIVFRSLSEGENLTLPVRKWIGDVDKYQAGPLNKFGDPLYSARDIHGLRKDARTMLYGQQPEQLTLKPDAGITKLPHDFKADGLTWLEILHRLQKNITRLSYDTWLSPTKSLGIWRRVLYVQVPTAEFKQLGIKFSDLIQQAMDAVAPECHDVKFVTADEFAKQSWPA